MPYANEQCLRAREDFPALSRSLDGQPLAFLDGPAGTQVPGPVIDAQNHAYRMFNTNTGGEFVTSRDLEEGSGGMAMKVLSLRWITKPIAARGCSCRIAA